MTYTVFRRDATEPIAAVVCNPRDRDAVQPHVPEGAVVAEDQFCPPGFARAFTKDEWERLNTEAA